MKNHLKYFLLIVLTTLLFFFPIFSSKIPFPGDLLINHNPYKGESYLGYLPGTYPNKAQGRDVITQLYPWKYFAIEEIKKGQIPFWNPYNFSGNPQMANFQTAVFYPLNIIYLIFPFNLAWTIFIMLQPILAGIFMYIFLSKALNLSRFSSFIGGIAFAFSSYMAVWIEYGNIGSTLLWLPLVLFLVKKLYEKITALSFLLLVLSLTACLLAGYIQVAFYIYSLSFAYFLFLLFLNKDLWLRKVLFLLLASFIPLCLAAFQILPTLELFSLSTRGSYTLEQISGQLLPTYHWATVLASDFFGNPASRNYFAPGTYIERVMYIGVLLIFFTALAVRFVKTKEVRFFVFVGLLSLILATNLPGVKYFYTLPIPVISTTVPTRELSIFIFALIVLGSIGLNFFISKKEVKSKLPLFFILAFVFLWIAAFALGLKVSQKNLILPSVLAVATVFIFYNFRRLGKLGLVGIAAIVIFDLLYFFNKITPFSPVEFTYPETPIISYLKKNTGINRFWGYGDAYIEPNFQTFDKTFSPEGNDPLRIAAYGELLASSKEGIIPKALPRPDANIAPGYGLTDLRSNFHRQRILNLLGIKYLLHRADGSSTFPTETYHPVFQTGAWQVYENRSVLPRYFMTGQFFKANNKEEVLSKIYDENFNLRNTLIIETDPNMLIESDGEVELVSYLPQKIMFNTKSEGNSLLFLSDNYYPGWKAKIDGKDSKVLIANYSFRAVEVPKGKHSVEFYYYPEKFLVGLKIALVGFMGLLFSLTYIKYVKR